jgi:hypothetical protein
MSLFRYGGSGSSWFDVSRFLLLAFLVSDIVKAIFAGKKPVELTSEKLKFLRNLPKSWEEQRQLLGFTG